MMGIDVLNLDWTTDDHKVIVASARKYLGLSCSQFAEELELGKDGERQVRRWEHGSRTVGYENARKIDALVLEAYREGAQSDYPRQYE